MKENQRADQEGLTPVPHLCYDQHRSHAAAALCLGAWLGLLAGRLAFPSAFSFWLTLGFRLCRI